MNRMDIEEDVLIELSRMQRATGVVINAVPVRVPNDRRKPQEQK